MPDSVRAEICALRRFDPNVDVNVIVAHVAKHCAFSTNDTTVKRILKAAGLHRRRGPSPACDTHGVQRLEFGGMKLVEAACVETQYVEALCKGIVGCIENAAAPTNPMPADTGGRDERGNFLPAYNERYRKSPDDAIGPGFRSVEEKRQERDPARFHIHRAQDETIRRKLTALLYSPLLGNGRWDGIRVPRGKFVGELCGYEYMPSTLELFARELKFHGVSNTLWEIHARKWLEQTRTWGTAQHAAVLYIDGTTKPVWTRLFSQSTKVSNVGRVMPGLETIAFNTGYGVPLWYATHSGRAPLVKLVPKYLTQLHAMTGDAEIGRIVVIDAEACSIPFLQGLEQGDVPRTWVTRLKPSMIEGKVIFNRTNFRSYRDGDRIRVGLADFPRPDGKPFRMRVVEIERRSKNEITYLGASERLSDRDWNASALADLYFERWPCQEANFRAVNQAVGAKDVHGYGKQLVDNVAVITELDELKQGIRKLETRNARASDELQKHKADLHAHEKTLRQEQRRSETIARHLDKLHTGQRVTQAVERMLDEQAALKKTQEKQEAKRQRLLARKEKTNAQLSNIAQRLADKREREATLAERTQIFRHDVEQDSLFSLLKVGLCLLVTFVKREYLADTKIAVATFLERIATLPATLRVTPELEILTFDYSTRDPEMMALLTSCMASINERAPLMRSGRRLRIQVETAEDTQNHASTKARRRTQPKVAISSDRLGDQ
jgi:hypothetical protein